MENKTPSVFNAFVHLTDPAGLHQTFGPGDPVPDWARLLVGDHVIHGGDGGPAEDYVVPPAHGTVFAQTPDTALTETPGFVPFGEDDELGVVEDPTPPPTAGPGSGRPAWVEFAKRVGQPVAPTQSRQDIIDALIRNGHLRE